MRVRSFLTSAIVGFLLLIIQTIVTGDTQLISEAFDSASGTNIASLGWSNIGSGQIVVSDVIIDKSNSALKTGNSTALYEKNLASAQALATGEVVTLIAVARVKSLTNCSNRVGVGVKCGAGVYTMEVYKSSGSPSASAWCVWLPGASTPLEFSLPPADVFDFKISLTSDRVRFYGRAHGTEYWNLVYDSPAGASSVSGVQIKMVDNNPTGTEYPRLDSVYLGYSDEFGKQWIRTHPFMLNAQSQVNEFCSSAAKFEEYSTACGLNSVTSYYSYAPAISMAKQYGLTWHVYLGVTTRSQSMISQVNGSSVATDDNGWYICDEPASTSYAGIGLVRDWIKQRRPYSLVYANAYPNLDDAVVEGFMTQIRPDVFMYDEYPYFDDVPDYQYLADAIQMYPFISTMRSKAQKHRLPVWTFLQSWYGPNMESHRASSFPSGSDLRRQIFAHLASGTKGFSYFTYDSTDNYILGLVNVDGSHSSLFSEAASANRETTNLGNPLRFLESTDIRYVPGLVGNATPEGLINWSAGAGGESRILAIGVTAPTTKKNAFIGFFTDDTGQSYFMLTNLYAGRTLSPAASAATYSISLSAGVTGVYRVSRLTGQQEWLPATGGNLSVTLPGGTGDLFTFSSVGFDLTAPAGTVSIESGSSHTTSTSVTLTLSATDDRGLGQMRFSDDNVTWSQWETYSVSKQWTLLSGDGSKTVYAQFRDSFGRTSATASDTIVLDSKVQNPVFSPGSCAFPGATTQSVSISCSTSGASIYYSSDGSAPSIHYTAPISISSDATLKAMATKADATPSDVVIAAYSFPTVTTSVSGIDVSGLLVRVWGKVTGVGGSGSGKYFYIDDGMNIYDGNESGYLGVRILADALASTLNEGSYALVTGIARPWIINGRVVRAVHPENDASLTIQ